MSSIITRGCSVTAGATAAATTCTAYAVTAAAAAQPRDEPSSTSRPRRSLILPSPNSPHGVTPLLRRNAAGSRLDPVP